MRWAAEWAKEGVAVDWRKLLPPKGFQVLPRRWVVERTIAWIDQNRRMSKDYERLCASGEAFVYAAMIRLMTSGSSEFEDFSYSLRRGVLRLRIDGVLEVRAESLYRGAF